MTYTDKQCDDDEHGGQVDGDHRLEVLVLVEVGAVADQVEDDGGHDDVEHYAQQLPAQADGHEHLLEQTCNPCLTMFDALPCCRIISILCKAIFSALREIMMGEGNQQPLLC